MSLTLIPITEADLKQYKKDMQEAFLLGAIEGGFSEDTDEILPEADIDCSLSAKGAIAYKAEQDGEMVGGAIIVTNDKKHSGHLDFLYVKHGVQSRGIGKFIWLEIEKLHPDIRVWETCTPYFEKRNIHFYINKCGFSAVEFFCEYNTDPNAPPDEHSEGPDEMFRFIKKMK